MTQGGGSSSRLGIWATEETSPTPVQNDPPASVGLDEVTGRISLEKNKTTERGGRPKVPQLKALHASLETCILLEVDIFMK